MNKGVRNLISNGVGTGGYDPARWDDRCGPPLCVVRNVVTLDTWHLIYLTDPTGKGDDHALARNHEAS